MMDGVRRTYEKLPQVRGHLPRICSYLCGVGPADLDLPGIADCMNRTDEEVCHDCLLVRGPLLHSVCVKWHVRVRIFVCLCRYV